MRWSRSLVAALLAAAPVVAGAQADVRVRAGRPNWGASRATITAPVIITNAGAAAVETRQRVELPEQWQLLMGEAPQTVAAGESVMLMLGATVPARVTAGSYVVRMTVHDAKDPRVLGADSIVVVVPRRRALEVALVERSSYIVSGKSYDAAFLVRNRGNAPSDIRVRARSSLGAVSLRDSAIGLAADESRLVRLRVRTPSDVDAAVDDVVELTAQEADTALLATASARVTVVPEPNRNIEEYVRVPTTVRLRAASTNGVSPYEVLGRGYLQETGNTQLDFLFRGPPGSFAVFGDRDEYRAELRSRAWRLRMGDQMFMLTPLTSGAQPGFGVGGDGTVGAVTAGGYSQQFRRVLQGGRESGAFLNVATLGGGVLGANVVDRLGGLIPGTIGSAAAALARPGFVADAEVARSRHQSSWGLARSARINGVLPALTYDIGYLYSDTAFAGMQRGAEHDYVTATARPWAVAAFGVNASTHRADLSRAVGIPYNDRLDIGNLSASLYDRLTVEGGGVRRTVASLGARNRGRQRQLRAHYDQLVRVGTLSLESEVGRARNDTVAARTFTDVSLGIRRAFTRGSAGGWVARYSGGSITKGASGTDTYGGDVALRLTRTTELMAMGFATLVRMPLSGWHSQMDVQIARLLPNGATVTLRARLLGGGVLPASQRTVAYLEYGMPVRLPVARLRTPGRVYGRVVDATSGRGVPGALVRLGPQVAITDNAGKVAFGGVPAGEHRLSMTQETSYANTVFVGDPTVRVDSTKRQPTTFELAVARSARVDVAVRRFTAVRTGLASAPDSLTDAGALENVTLMLVSGRDTVYDATGANGTTTFTDVPPGNWMLIIGSEAPAFQRFDPDRMELTLGAGETRPVSFRLVPRKREVQIIGAGEELKAMPPKPPQKPD